MPVRRRLGLIALVLLVAGFVGLGLSRITFDVDITRLLPPGMKETVGYRLFLRNFSRPDELLVALEGAEAAKVEQAAAALAQRLQAGTDPLARRVIWRSPFSVQAPSDAQPQAAEAQGPSDGFAEFLAWSLLNQPPEFFAALEEKVSPERIEGNLEATLERLGTSIDGSEGLLGYDPFGLAAPVLQSAGKSRGMVPDFVSPDGTFRLVYVESAREVPNYKAMTAWLADVRTAAGETCAPLGVTVRFTGEPAFVSEISNTMERDMKLSGGVALGLICLIVWIGYRALRLLPALVAVIGLTFVCTLATCGVVLGSLTVLTVGFGSILIGLTVDYGVLIWHARCSAPEGRAEMMARTRRGIFWACATSAASFAALVPCGMPGLAELGLLVAVGVVLGAVAFLWLFPRLLDRFVPAPASASPAPPSPTRAPTWLAWPVLGVSLLAVSGIAVRGLPRVEGDSGSLRPRHSEAYDTLDMLTSRLSRGDQVLSVLVTGRDETEVASRLSTLDGRLRAAAEAGTVKNHSLPRVVWPVPANQRAVLAGPGARLAAQAPRLRASLLAAGFTEEAFGLTGQVLAHWEKWAARPPQDAAFWPEGAEGAWLLRRFAVARSSTAESDPATASMVMGMIEPRDAAAIPELESLQTEGVYLAGSKLIGRAMERYLSEGFVLLAGVFAVVTFALLAFALRRVRPFTITLASLGLGFAALIGSMSWFGLTWNAFTLPALLLSLGTGSDYFIYVILELEEHGSLQRMRERLLRPLLVCVGNSVCGFGSLAWAGNLGLSNLGRVCALALGFNVLIALFVMPVLWKTWQRRTS